VFHVPVILKFYRGKYLHDSAISEPQSWNASIDTIANNMDKTPSHVMICKSKADYRFHCLKEHFVLMSDTNFNLLCDRCNNFHISAENVIEFP